MIIVLHLNENPYLVDSIHNLSIYISNFALHFSGNFSRSFSKLSICISVLSLLTKLTLILLTNPLVGILVDILVDIPLYTKFGFFDSFIKLIYIIFPGHSHSQLS